MKTVETTATEVYIHAADHGDRPVIHGAEIDYDDVHDGVHYHADLLAAAREELTQAIAKEDRAASDLAIRVDHAEGGNVDPREWPGFTAALAAYRKADKATKAAYDKVQALKAKRDQDAAMATYEVSA